jgi:hypothetical protein
MLMARVLLFPEAAILSEAKELILRQAKLFASLRMTYVIEPLILGLMASLSSGETGHKSGPSAGRFAS